MKLPFIGGNKDEVQQTDQIVMLETTKIKPNPYQPRTTFDEKEIEELAESIRNYGVIQPLTVREQGDYYQLVAGERRLRASQRAGLTKVPVVIRELDDKEIAEIALIENLQRKDLNFLEEASAYQKLLESFGMTQQDLAESIGKSQSTIANKLRILNLPEETLQELDSPGITERHARALLKLADSSKQLKVLEKVKKENLTVKDTEKLIARMLSDGEKKNRVITVYKDLRIFTNTLKKSIDEMKSAGLDVQVKQEEHEKFIEFSIRLQKQDN